MFTGIIEQTGTLVSLTDRGGVRRITVEAPGIANRLREGDSLAISGVCLTALDVDPTDPRRPRPGNAGPHISRRSQARRKAKSRIADRSRQSSGGHVVQGHVDGTGIMTALDPVIPETSPQFNREATDWTLKVRIPENVRPWMVHKGSVAVEGISLTIAAIEDDTISIAILPLTYWRTNLHALSVGAPVNVEADVLVKLAYQQMQSAKKPEFDLTESWLVANGY